jgi:hypothetical protein
MWLWKHAAVRSPVIFFRTLSANCGLKFNTQSFVTFSRAACYLEEELYYFHPILDYSIFMLLQLTHKSVFLLLLLRIA